MVLNGELLLPNKHGDAVVRQAGERAPVVQQPVVGEGEQRGGRRAGLLAPQARVVVAHLCDSAVLLCDSMDHIFTLVPEVMLPAGSAALNSLKATPRMPAVSLLALADATILPMGDSLMLRPLGVTKPMMEPADRTSRGGLGGCGDGGGGGASTAGAAAE